MTDRNIEFIADCLSPDDDESFWETACLSFFNDASEFKPNDEPLFIEIGLCSNWIKPSYKRFTDMHGQPLPEDSEKEKLNFARLSLPEYDWSMIFYYDKKSATWKAGEIPAENYICLRCALPAKTASLQHAVGHSAWVSSREISTPMLYSFKKSAEGQWECFINPLSKKKN